VLKFADNIARVYAHAVAMIATMLLSVQVMRPPLTLWVMLPPNPNPSSSQWCAPSP